MIPAVIISCSCYTAEGEAAAEAAVTATTIDKLTVTTTECTKTTASQQKQQCHQHHRHHHKSCYHHHRQEEQYHHYHQQTEQTHCQQLYSKTDIRHQPHHQQQLNLNSSLCRQRQRPSGIWHKRSQHNTIVTYYLWWLFGICLIFSTNGGRNLNIGNLVMKSSTLTTLPQLQQSSSLRISKSLWSSSSIFAAASYLEPDELIHELDRPGKHNIL